MNLLFLLWWLLSAWACRSSDWGNRWPKYTKTVISFTWLLRASCRECSLVRISVGHGYVHTYSELTLSGSSRCCLCHQRFNLIVSDLLLMLATDYKSVCIYQDLSPSMWYRQLQVFPEFLPPGGFPLPTVFQGYPWVRLQYIVPSHLTCFSVLCRPCFPLLSSLIMGSSLCGIGGGRGWCGAAVGVSTMGVRATCCITFQPVQVWSYIYHFHSTNGILLSTSDFMIQQII